MSKTVKQIAEELYSKSESYEEKVRLELYNLQDLLKQVGGSGEMVSLMDMDVDKFLDMLFRNGITFTLTDEKKEKLVHKTFEEVGGTEIIGT